MIEERELSEEKAQKMIEMGIIIENKIYKTEELAILLGVGKETIKKWYKKGLPHTKLITSVTLGIQVIEWIKTMSNEKTEVKVKNIKVEKYYKESGLRSVK